ncbi:hypothetical protein CICLE_v10006265mg [Citrus x clementina]|uniref:Uncharacterized protein n=1 Tax=Citrus clementina TaxID=85681 RepID=V4S482_CITCL|nr:uncharacterized protein LOC18032175 isoform X1 [Citrus x clementina]ESR35127.1 hypothetical protein CICLE_v10006265mg [Citrus x clementina]
MDTANRSSSFSGPWTNEKHLHYLNAMEAAFVHKMLDNKRRLPRLDRYLPDTSDSTLDLNTHPTKKQATTSRSSAGNKTGMDSRADKRLTRRRRSNRPYTSSEDQVVPQIEK